MSTTVLVLAKNVQRDCYLIQRWLEKETKRLADNHLRYRRWVQVFMERKPNPWWSFLIQPAKSPLDWKPFTMKWDKFMGKKHVRAWAKHEDRLEPINRLMAAAERALGESNKLSGITINLSSEDALFLKTYINKAKEKK